MTSYLLWLMLSALAIAQTDLNFTLIFSPESQETCSTTNSTSGLTFTTKSVPIVSSCFNIADLFQQNTTNGFRNQSRNQVGVSTSSDDPVGIEYTLKNLDEYDPATNYSHVWYRLHIPPQSNEDYESDAYADRRVVVYGGEDCTEVDPNGNRNLLDWYGWSCWTENEGSCGKLPYSIASFSMQPGPGPDPDDDEVDGKCWTFAQMGAGEKLVRPAGLGVALVVVAALFLV